MYSEVGFISIYLIYFMVNFFVDQWDFFFLVLLIIFDFVSFYWFVFLLETVHPHIVFLLYGFKVEFEDLSLDFVVNIILRFEDVKIFPFYSSFYFVSFYWFFFIDFFLSFRNSSSLAGFSLSLWIGEEIDLFCPWISRYFFCEIRKWDLFFWAFFFDLFLFIDFILYLWICCAIWEYFAILFFFFNLDYWFRFVFF